jgi:hypothetical protein
VLPRHGHALSAPRSQRSGGDGDSAAAGRWNGWRARGAPRRPCKVAGRALPRPRRSRSSSSPLHMAHAPRCRTPSEGHGGGVLLSPPRSAAPSPRRISRRTRRWSSKSLSDCAGSRGKGGGGRGGGRGEGRPRGRDGHGFEEEAAALVGSRRRTATAAACPCRSSQCSRRAVA